jgi:hypothetical protein
VLANSITRTEHDDATGQDAALDHLSRIERSEACCRRAAVRLAVESYSASCEGSGSCSVSVTGARFK